jgi:hypothetical protein
MAVRQLEGMMGSSDHAQESRHRDDPDTITETMSALQVTFTQKLAANRAKSAE